MILKVVFIFLGVVCAVGLGKLVGGLTDVDVNEEGVQNALNFAISQHNLKTEDPFLRVKTGVVGVKKQIVSGMKYVITVNMTKTNCLKDAPNEQCNGLAESPAGPVHHEACRTHDIGIKQPKMKVLQKDEQMTAESVLLKHLPKSLQVYGYLHACNRNKQTNVQIVVDTWPDFKVIICRPDPENKQASDWRKNATFYCLDEKILRKMLLEEDAIDWSADFILKCFDNSHTGLLEQVSAQRQVSHTRLICAYQLYLPDSSHLVTPAFNSDIKSRISSLDISHAHLVNQTWKFGGDEFGYKKIVRQISNFPSYCITDHQGQPVSWLLLHENLSLGMLYTLPEHRRKGYATVLVYTMAQRLLTEGYPVFSHVEEGNMVPFKMFKNLGFIDDPSVRRIWFKFAT